MTKEKQKELKLTNDKNLRRLQNFRLLDDDFMSKVFEDKSCAEYLLRIILNRDDLLVNDVSSQYTIKNLQGRSVRLDILATDSDGYIYNIEVQRDNGGATAKRARYNSSMIDANITAPGDSYEMLAETFVIFITELDVLRKGLPIYHIDRIIFETGETFGDDSHIIYVNSMIRDDTALGRLMHDFYCTNADEMYYRVLADRVRFFKEKEKGVSVMKSVVDEIRMEGAQERTVMIAEAMLKDGSLSYEKISQFTKLSVDEIKALASEQSA